MGKVMDLAKGALLRYNECRAEKLNFARGFVS